MVKGADTIRFALFADLHYKKGMYIPTAEDLAAILRRAHENDVEFVIHLGDFCNDYLHSPEITQVYINNSYGLPVYGVYGNHELETRGNSMEVVTPLLNNRRVVWGRADGRLGDGSIGYFYTDMGDFRLVCLDTNYSLNPESGAWEHNTPNSYGAPLTNIYHDSVDPAQLDWLEAVLTDGARGGKKCMVFSHSGFSGVWMSSPTADRVRDIFRKANGICKGTVVLAASGHLHTNQSCVIEDVVYLDVHTVRNTLWVPNEEAFEHYEGVTYKFIDHDDTGRAVSVYDRNVSELRMAKNTWFSTDPLSAIVAVSKDGKIVIEGMESSWLEGISPTIELGDEVFPRITSKEFSVR